MNFTIKSINKDGSVDVVFGDEKKPQNISGLPAGDSDALTQALVNYAVAYQAGKEIEAKEVEVVAEVKDLVGTKVDVEAFLAEQAKEVIEPTPETPTEEPVIPTEEVKAEEVTPTAVDEVTPVVDTPVVTE